MELVVVVGLLSAARDAAIPAGTTPPQQDTDNGCNHYDAADDAARNGTRGRRRGRLPVAVILVLVCACCGWAARAGGLGGVALALDAS